MGNKMVILVLVLALVSIPGIASSQEELPLEIEWRDVRSDVRHNT